MADDPAQASLRARAARRLVPVADGRPALDRLTALTARILNAPSALASLITDRIEVIAAHAVEAVLITDVELSDSLCAITVRAGRPVVVNDAGADARVASTRAVRERHVGAFLGVPIRADDRTVVGALCVFGPAPRIWAQDEVATIEALAETAATELELAALARDFEASRARWDLAIDAAGIGTFDWDLRTGRLSWDQTLIELFGYGDDDVFTETIEAFNARLHPDDVPPVAEALERAIETLGDYEAEYRVVLPGGEIRQVQARGRALGEDGTAHRLLGAAWDVSATRSGEERAARIVEAMPVAYARLSQDGTFVAMNQLAERLLRTNRLDLLGQPVGRIVPSSVAGELEALGRAVALMQEVRTVELYVPSPVDAWLEIRGWPEAPGVALYFSDVTARRAERVVAENVAAHDRAVAEALQNALLTRLPQPDRLEIAARYLTAAAGDLVGGDWYDAVLQPDGALTLVAGDVVGHDIHAAATMGQLRSMLRAFVWESDDSPAVVLSRLDHIVQDLYSGVYATVVTARIEQGADDRALGNHTLRWSSAGHLPPLIVEPDGTVHRAPARPELMLGVDRTVRRTDHLAPLRPGAILALYTDGLVERRRDDLDDGIDRLADALARHRALPVEQLLDAVIDDLGDPESDDDVVLLVLRLQPT